MNKVKFIKSYIEELENVLEDCDNPERYEFDIFDCIKEVRGVFIGDFPEIDKAISLRNGSAESDARIIIGILKSKILEEDNEDKRKFERNFKRLKLEYNGINKVIREYTSKGNITNYLEELNKAISTTDIENIKYCLEEIKNWYNKNISKILSNKFVRTPESHKENKEKIEEFVEIFNEYNEEEIDLNNEEVEKVHKIEAPIIFLSHKSDDKKYADALAKFVTDLGVKDNRLVYTSHPLHKIPLDANIYSYLREKMNSKVFVIILWSDEYLESPACLNEMGAAWVSKSDYTNIYVPTFSFGNPKYHQCAVDTRKMGAVLNGDEHCKVNMIELKDKIQKIFGLENDEKKTLYTIDKFIEEIKNINSNSK